MLMMKRKNVYACYKHKFLYSRNPVTSETEAIKVAFAAFGVNREFMSALKDSGYREVTDKRDGDTQYFLPCPVGTFSNSSSQGVKRCTPCPPGIIRTYVNNNNNNNNNRIFMKDNPPVPLYSTVINGVLLAKKDIHKRETMY